MNATTRAELPDLFRFQDGTPVRDPDEWRRRRAELLELIMAIQYGPLPPSGTVTAEVLHNHKARRLLDAQYTQVRIGIEEDRAFHFRLDLLIPAATGPFPVVLNGDGCWRYVTDEVALEVLRRGNIMAQFSRVEIVPDMYRPDRDSGLYLVYPEEKFGALTAWAWGYHRCVDYLLSRDDVDPAGIAVVGHSRGGKTALLAGATDERIAVTGANDSGAGGAGCYRWQGPESETLADSLRAIAYWYSPRLREFLDRVEELPFDQHSLKAAVAPRALVTTEALGDLWANPTGTWQTYLAAREVYRFLNVEERIGIWFREGQHFHGPEDWAAFLDFTDWHLCDQIPSGSYDCSPFPDLPPAFSWSAPPVWRAGSNKVRRRRFTQVGTDKR